MRFRVCRLARAATATLLAGSLLSGCATISGQSNPAALGAGKHRSIKDDPEPAVTLAPAPKQAPARTAMAPQRPPQAQPDTAKFAAPPSCATGSDCMVRLRAMVDDPSRGWMRQRQSSVEYANGTRLFAYRALSDRLSCPELTLALNEIDAAATTFRSPVVGINAGQAAHLLTLNTQVGQELRVQFSRRCRT